MPILRKPFLPVLSLLLCGLACLSAAAVPVSKPSAAPAKSHTTTIPFAYDPILMPYIVVQASINGHPPLSFVVDTGASGGVLFIEPWAAEKLRLPRLTAPKNQDVLAQGRKTLTGTLLKSFRIIGSQKGNGFHFTTNTATEAQIKKSNQRSPFQIVDIVGFTKDNFHGPRLAGIIPALLLALPGEICQLDFQHELMTITRKTKGWKPPVGSATVPLRYDDTTDRLYKFTATLSAGKSVDLALDTGNPVNSVQNMVVLLPLDVQSVQSVWAEAQRKGAFDEVLVPQLRFGGLNEANVTLEETDPVLATGAPNTIGLDFLSRFLVTLDLFDRKMYLKRRTDYARQIVPAGRSGVRLEKRGAEYAAAWVQPGSPAEVAGLRIGDQIEQADGQPLAALPWSPAQILLDGHEGTSAKLTVRTANGKEVMLRFVRSPKFTGRRHALLGVQLEWVQNNLMVASVTPGSPLDGKLKFSDDIYFINGESVAKMTMDEALQKLERPDLELQAWRDSDKTWRELHIAPLSNQTQVIVGPPLVGYRFLFYDRAGWTEVPK